MLKCLLLQAEAAAGEPMEAAEAAEELYIQATMH
jgi:hypothetical protein